LPSIQVCIGGQGCSGTEEAAKTIKDAAKAKKAAKEIEAAKKIEAAKVAAGSQPLDDARPVLSETSMPAAGLGGGAAPTRCRKKTALGLLAEAEITEKKERAARALEKRVVAAKTAAKEGAVSKTKGKT
jgi:hypothetical protein